MGLTGGFCYPWVGGVLSGAWLLVFSGVLVCACGEGLLSFFLWGRSAAFEFPRPIRYAGDENAWHPACCSLGATFSRFEKLFLWFGFSWVLFLGSLFCRPEGVHGLGVGWSGGGRFVRAG